MNTFLTWAISALALSIVVECLRRSARMHVLPHGGCRTRPTWALLYWLTITGAAYAIYDTCARSPQVSTLLLLSAAGLQLLLSRPTWRQSSPLHTMIFSASQPPRRAWPWPGDAAEE